MTGEKFLKQITEQWDENQGLDWTQTVQYVEWGPCSLGHDKDPIEHMRFYLGNQSLPDGYVVVVLSDCCHQYGPDMQAQIRALFPNLVFLFPQHSNYGGHIAPWKSSTAMQLGKDLVRAGLLSKP